jgi:hypothetical protein
MDLDLLDVDDALNGREFSGMIHNSSLVSCHHPTPSKPNARTSKSFSQVQIHPSQENSTRFQQKSMMISILQSIDQSIDFSQRP